MMTDEMSHRDDELQRAADFIELLSIIADGGHPMVIDGWHASTILMLIEDRKYRRQAMSRWTYTYGTNNPAGDR
jgi:hypothetical protein